jgi:hypothetical protein
VPNFISIKWDRFLAERQTDQVYADLVDFFVELYTTPSNFEWKDEEEEKEYGEWVDPAIWDDLLADWDSMDEGVKDAIKNTKRVFKKYITNPPGKNLIPEEEEPPEPPAPIYGMSHQYFLVEPRIREAWKKLKNIPGALNVLGMETEDDFTYKIKDSTTLEISYGLANFEMITYARYRVQEDPEINERLRGVYADGMLGINLAAKGFNVSEQEFLDLGEEGVLGYVADKKGFVRETVEHELTHMINHFRAGTLKRAKGIGRQHWQKDPETQGNIRYANSTEEIQARLIPIFKFVTNVIGAPPAEVPDDPSSQTAALIGYEVENFAGNENLANIVKLLFKLYEIEHPGWVKLLSSKNRQRIMNRFYEFAEELTE